VAASSMTVRQTEVLVKKIQLGTSEKAAAKPYAVDPDIIRVQEALSEKIGAAVLIQHGVKGSGSLIVKYNSVDELEGILSHIK